MPADLLHKTFYDNVQEEWFKTFPGDEPSVFETFSAATKNEADDADCPDGSWVEIVHLIRRLEDGTIER